jgi:ribosome assembly protein YihI (activator of Der GTPase)
MVEGIASHQEGLEWLSKLQLELDALSLDLLQHGNILSAYTVANIEYAIDNINQIMAELRIELDFIEE